ncbi:Charged multivesicular body protein 1b-2 [Larimichthys crocea]|uniref:Uncharacterized protein n=1 Tax=Larimichthys crocea TaxID=215358 RepID=A0ACD3REE3_LARCR|nr:Charged multivesicular body protein 1b-2 [Larimichthys crocea]
MSSNMEKHLFNLKFAAKELQRNSKKCDKEERAEKAKVKQVSKSMSGVVKSMDATLKSMNLEKNEVDSLLHEMADEAGLDLNLELPSGQTSSLAASVASTEQDELSQRLARLRDQVS